MLSGVSVSGSGWWLCCAISSDLPDAEIAEVLGCKPSTVRSLVASSFTGVAKGVGMSSIEKRMRDELGELASWLIDRRTESNSVEQADSGSDSIPRDSGSDSIPRDSGADSIPRLDLDADTVRPGGRNRLFRVAAVLLLIVGVISASRLLSENVPSVVTAPSRPHHPDPRH